MSVNIIFESIKNDPTTHLFDPIPLLLEYFGDTE